MRLNQTSNFYRLLFIGIVLVSSLGCHELKAQEWNEDFIKILKTCVENDKMASKLFIVKREDQTVLYLYANNYILKNSNYEKVYAKMSSTSDLTLLILSTSKGGIYLFFDPFSTQIKIKDFLNVFEIQKFSKGAKDATLIMYKTTATENPVSGFDYEKIKFKLVKNDDIWKVENTDRQKSQFKKLR